MKTLLTTLFLGISISIFGQQWLGSSSSSSDIFRNGNVGIGTIAPTEKLQIGEYNSTEQNNIALWSKFGEAGEQSKFKFKMSVLGGMFNSTIAEIVPSTYVNNAKNRLDFKVGDWNNNNNSGEAKLSILSSGNVGIGTIAPTEKLQIGEYNSAEQNNIALWSKFGGAGEQSKIKFKMSVVGGMANSTIAEIVTYTYVNNAKNRLDFKVGDWNNNSNSGEAKLSILSSGNILIGKTEQQNSNYRLDVNGSIRANEIVVNTTGADFVFANDYNLLPLQQLDEYIKTNDHLPEMKSATEMQNEGLGISEMQTKLLQKIEELTLYAIEQQKFASDQQKRIELLEKRIANSQNQ